MSQTKAQLLEGKAANIEFAVGSAASPTLFFTGDTNTGIYSPAADSVAVVTGGTQRTTVDPSGRLLVGTSTARSNLGSTTPLLQAETATTSSSASASLSLVNNQGAGGAPPAINLGLTRSASIGGTTKVESTDELGLINFLGSDGTNFIPGARISSTVDGTTGTNDMPGRLVFSTTADGASSPTERMRINSLGNAFIGGGGVTTQTATRLIITNPNATENQSSLIIENSSFFASIYCFNVNTGGVSTTNAAMWVQKSSSTSRSINAAGTINASGADYAEYMTKGGDFTITKGDICGIDPDGKLTTSFINSISFVVKSTNPSYVGSDTWGSEAAIGKKPDIDDLEVYAQWESDLEAARQTVDRIAFAGQVPVNVTGATPGQYIVPVKSADGGIECIAKDEADLTLTEYMRAVGKVIAIEDDGRARVIVKVA